MMPPIWDLGIEHVVDDVPWQVQLSTQCVFASFPFCTTLSIAAPRFLSHGHDNNSEPMECLKWRTSDYCVSRVVLGAVRSETF